MTRAIALVAGALAVMAPPAVASPVLRTAESRIVFQSATACAVDLTLEVAGAAQVEHRIEVAQGARVELLGVHGAARIGSLEDVGRTRALVVRPAASIYTLRYTVEQPPDRSHRCPLWIPTLPADGRSAAIRLLARIPAGTTPAGTMPAFTWSDEEGVARLGHMPAFIRVPFTPSGSPPPLDVSRLMDMTAAGTLVVATLAWLRRRRQSGGAGHA